MADIQEHIPESPSPDKKPLERISFIDMHGIHPMAFAVGSLALIFILYQIGGGILTYFVGGVTSITPEKSSAIRWMTMIGQLAFIFFPTLILTKLFTVRFKEVYLFRVPKLLESAFALIALVSLIIAFEAYMYFQEMVPMPEVLRELAEPYKKGMEELTRVVVHANSPAELMTVILVVAVVPAIVEELLFRGLIQKVFERLMSPVVSAILAGTVFGLFHLNPFEVVPLIGIGVFLGMLRYRSQTILLPILVHFINNFIAILAVYYGLNEENILIQQQSSPDAGTMLFILIVSISLFFISFVAYLRITHNISRKIF
jgi:membrane protease YdiL (CAAX protease family)